MTILEKQNQNLEKEIFENNEEIKNLENKKKNNPDKQDLKLNRELTSRKNRVECIKNIMAQNQKLKNSPIQKPITQKYFWGESKEEILFQAPKKLNEIQGVESTIVNRDYLPFAKAEYNILAGEGGVGKSLIALNSVVIFLKQNPKENALIYFTEDLKINIESRLARICEIQNANYSEIHDKIFFVTKDDNINVKFVTKQGFGYKIAFDYLDNLTNFIKDNQIGFCVFDPLKAFHRLTENDNSEMDVLVRDVFSQMATYSKAVILCLHHTSKGEKGILSRGASTITDSARLAYIISKYYKNGVLIQGAKDLIILRILKDNHSITENLKCVIWNSETQDNDLINPMKGKIVRNQLILYDFKNKKPPKSEVFEMPTSLEMTEEEKKEADSVFG